MLTYESFANTHFHSQLFACFPFFFFVVLKRYNQLQNFIIVPYTIYNTSGCLLVHEQRNRNLRDQVAATKVFLLCPAHAGGKRTVRAHGISFPDFCFIPSIAGLGKSAGYHRWPSGTHTRGIERERLPEHQHGIGKSIEILL